MTEWVLIGWDQSCYSLPQPIRWQLNYGLGVPCDSVQLLCPWSAGKEEILENAVRLTVKREEEIVFTAVVDECECVWGERGCTVEITGRGLQALLLDNEAVGADFGAATLEDILSRYVTPYGISLAEPVKLPAVPGFSVKTGSSCWQVLYQFARYHGGVTPRFDPLGRLLLSPWNDTEKLQLDDTAPLKKLLLRNQRYGVLSQIQVVNRVTLASQTVVNERFQKKGGCCSRVLTMPRNSGYQTMRYNGQFQLDQSKSELRRVEVTLAKPFLAWPGELISIKWSNWSGNGSYRVLESTVQMHEQGYETTLLLGDPTAVL